MTQLQLSAHPCQSDPFARLFHRCQRSCCSPTTITSARQFKHFTPRSKCLSVHTQSDTVTSDGSAASTGPPATMSPCRKEQSQSRSQSRSQRPASACSQRTWLRDSDALHHTSSDRLHDRVLHGDCASESTATGHQLAQKSSTISGLQKRVCFFTKRSNSKGLL